MFLLGFLGLVGFLLKDSLPGIFPSLTTQEEPAENGRKEVHLPAITPTPPTQNSTPVPAPKFAGNTTPEATPPASTLVEAGTKQAPMIGGFDPTEPVPPKAQLSTTEQSAAVGSASSSTPLVATTVPVESSPKMPEAGNTLLEVPVKPAANAASAAAKTSTPTGLTQTNPAEEDDAPSEAKPAVEALKQFLGATSLPERLQHTLGAEHMKPLMERYYTRSADGPIIVDRIQFIRMDPNPELGSGRHCIFNLENKTWEFPVPVMLEEQPDGFKVDWLAFVEFKDRLLEKFFQSYQEGAARFHVGIIRHHYFEDGVPNVDRKYAFRIMPAPPNSFQASVFLDKESPLAQDLRIRLPWETHVWAVVELEWKKLGSQQWVELSAVPQMHWYSLPLPPHPISTPQKTTEQEMPPGISKNGSGSKSSSNQPPPGITKSNPSLPATIKRPLPSGR